MTYMGFLLVGFLLTGCFAPTLERAGLYINSKPALWVARDADTTVYLFGSRHVLPPQVRWYSPKIERAYKNSQRLVFETLINEETKAKYMRYTKKYGFLPEGKVISDYLTEKEYVKYQSIVKSLKMDSYYSSRMKPWLFLQNASATALKEQSKYGVDTLFQSAGKRDKKKMMALETVEEGLSSFMHIPLKKDIKDLKKILHKKAIDKKKMRENLELLLSWVLGDVPRTQRLIAKGMPPALYKKLINQRNNQWYPKIKKLFKTKGTTLIVVGQAHLIGKGNIIDKLKYSGYKVSRIQ